MFGGNHYKKKIDKKERKKAAATAAPAPVINSHNKSKLSGPIVSHSEVRYAPDDANFGGQQAIGTKRSRGQSSDGFTTEHTKGRAGPVVAPTALSSASSKAQKKRFSRASGDDLLSQFKAKLSGSTFRLLNEQLYNSTSEVASSLLADPNTFEDYHTGYRQQLQQWPVDPNMLIADAISKHKEGMFNANPKEKSGFHKHSTIVDMGCGDAKVAATLTSLGYTKVHSFDLCENEKNKPFITVCSTTNTPLKSNQADVCFFSLSLMGTDWFSSIIEAHRILRHGGSLLILEVRSRIPDAQQFAEVVSSADFKCQWYGVVGSYFVAYNFVRGNFRSGSLEPKPRVHPGDVLLPSQYKKR